MRKFLLISQIFQLRFFLMEDDSNNKDGDNNNSNKDDGDDDYGARDVDASLAPKPQVCMFYLFYILFCSTISLFTARLQLQLQPRERKGQHGAKKATSTPTMTTMPHSNKDGDNNNNKDNDDDDDGARDASTSRAPGILYLFYALLNLNDYLQLA